MVDTRWRYWQFLDRSTGDADWIGVTRPDARPRIDRIKVWTFLPDKSFLVANWFLTADHQRPDADRRWEHDSITGWEFCDLALTVALPSAEDLSRLTHPAEALTVAQVDRLPLVRIVGKREAERIRVSRLEL